MSRIKSTPSTTSATPKTRRPTRPFTAAERVALETDEGMAAWLTDRYGRKGWAYDSLADLWVIRDPSHDGPGRGFILIQRGGAWRQLLVPVEVLQ